MPIFVRKYCILIGECHWREHLGANKQRTGTEAKLKRNVCTDHLEETTVRSKQRTVARQK